MLCAWNRTRDATDDLASKGLSIASASDEAFDCRVPQESPFCPNIAATPDGKQVWFTLIDIGKVTVFEARPPFAVLKTIDTGPITNHVNFANTTRGEFAYVPVGGLNQVTRD